MNDWVRTLALTPRQQARRKAILKCARSELGKYGYKGVSMRKVAEQAGVSPSTLYDIYKSKEHLVLYALEEDLLDLVAEEEHYDPGLERFIHRLESIATFFERDEETGLSIVQLFTHANANSPANEILLINAMTARRTSVLEMLEMKQLKQDIDVEFYTRALVSVTWGAAIMFARHIIAIGDFRSELIRSSMCLLLPVASKRASQRMMEIVDLFTERS